MRQPVLRRDPTWERRGYVWAEATIDAETIFAPTAFYQEGSPTHLAYTEGGGHVVYARAPW